jgi:hypothetical protein
MWWYGRIASENRNPTPTRRPIMSWIDEVISAHRRRILRVVPTADVRVTGGALLDGEYSVDIDLVALVDDVAAAANVLAAEYPALYPNDRRDDWAAFRDPGPPQVDIVVTRIGTKGDAHHRRAWDLLLQRPDLLAEYRQLRSNRRTGYEERKAEFFERVVALLPPVRRPG